MRANTRIVNALQAFGRTRSMTSAQVALGWLLQKAPWIVPIPGTTKLSHLEENLRTLDFNISSGEWKELEDAMAAIPVVGDRYNAEQQRHVYERYSSQCLRPQITSKVTHKICGNSQQRPVSITF